MRNKKNEMKICHVVEGNRKNFRKFIPSFICRVPPAESFFRLSESNPPKCADETYEVAECHCQGRENGGSINVTCETLVDVNKQPILRSRYSCSGPIRRKRSTFADEDGDFISLDYINSKIDHSKDTYVENINRVWPTPSGITLQQATDRCKQLLPESTCLHNVLWIQQCSGAGANLCG